MEAHLKVEVEGGLVTDIKGALEMRAMIPGTIGSRQRNTGIVKESGESTTRLQLFLLPLAKEGNLLRSKLSTGKIVSGGVG